MSKGLALDAVRQGRDVVEAPESAARVRVSLFSARRGDGIRVSIGS